MDRREVRRQRILQNTERRLRKIENVNKNNFLDEEDNEIGINCNRKSWNSRSSNLVDKSTELPLNQGNSPPIPTVQTPPVQTLKNYVLIRYCVITAFTFIVYVLFCIFAFDKVFIPFICFQVFEHTFYPPPRTDPSILSLLLSRFVSPNLSRTFIQLFTNFLRIYRDFMLYMFVFVCLNMLLGF